MRDVLEYTEDELRSLSDEELHELLKESEYKETFWNTRQLVEKRLINALYGALANKHFPLFNEHIASAITGNGRFFIQKLASNIEKELQAVFKQKKPYIIYGDTDSIYFHIEPFMEHYIKNNPNKEIGEYVDVANLIEDKYIRPIIEKTIDEFATQLNAFKSDTIGAKREIIADTAVFCAKKKYYARVRDAEGTRYPDNDPYYKVMGLEIIKSSTPKWSKKYLKQSIPHILDKDESDLRAWLNNIKQEFINADLNDIAGVSSVSRLDYNLGDKGVPIGSRAAICHNEYIKNKGLENKYTPIQPGDKTKRLFLQTPNEFNTDIIAFTNDSFVEEIKDCIDYDTNFEKNFLKPLSLMVDVLNYNLEKETVKLEDW